MTYIEGCTLIEKSLVEWVCREKATVLLAISFKSRGMVWRHLGGPYLRRDSELDARQAIEMCVPYPIN